NGVHVGFAAEHRIAGGGFMPDGGVGGGKWSGCAGKISCGTGLVVAQAAPAGEWRNAEEARFGKSDDHRGTNWNCTGRFGVCDSGPAGFRENVHGRAHDL